MNFEMKATTEGVYDIYIYDDIKPDRVTWDGELVKSKTDALTIKAELDKVPDGSKINLYINSAGGDVKTGLAIYSQLSRKECEITGYVDGFACSIASVILMACDRVILYPTSLIMIHCASGALYGNADAHRQFADDLDIISNSATEAYLAKAGGKLNRETLDELLKAESWLSAADCLKYGLADEIITKAEPTETVIEQYKKQLFDLAVKMQAGMGNVEKEEKQPDMSDNKPDVESIELKNSINSDFNNVVDTLFSKLF